MNIRRDRTHQCGLTNLDFRTKGEIESVDRYNPNLKYADFGTMGKSQYNRMTSAAATEFKDRVKLTGGWKTMTNLNNNPRTETTQDFYKSKGKKIKGPVQIGVRKDTQLEEEKWTDKVFTGDNPKLTAFLSGQARERESIFNADFKKRRLQQHTDDQKTASKSYQKRKEDIHAEAEQETQLVRMKNNETLEGKVDLTKVKDIRRALRRRYATRNNFQKIFTQWDTSSKGHIDVSDLHHMMNKMGLKVNLDEAQVLLISADQDNNNQLSMNEFMDLIFSQNDALNVDLSKVESVHQTEDLFQKYFANTQNLLLDDIRNDAQSIKVNRQMNQWKLFIQKNLNNISLDILNIDQDKQNSIDERDLMRVIEKRANIPEYLKQSQDQLHKFIEEYSDGESGKVNYRDMIEHLRGFDYERATNEKSQQVVASSSRSSAQSDILNQVQRKTRTIFDDDYVILDSQKVPPNTLEQIQRRLVKVNRHFQRVFGSQKQLDQFIKENMKPDKNGNVSVDQLKDFVIAHCKDEMVQKKMDKKDIEGFLSAFIYNTYGSTNVEAIAPLVFTDDNYVAKKLNNRTRGNPPPPDVNGDLDLYEVGNDDIHNHRVKEVLKNLEEKVFSGPVKMFQVFKQFDKDGDGFVSYADFEDQMNALQISASKREIAGILKHLDKDNKGFLDFRAFSTSVNPHMSNQINVQNNDIHLPNLVPNKDRISHLATKTNQLQEAVNQVRRSFQPDIEARLVAPTRFSSKPPPPNTFMNFQPGPKTPGFISERDRLLPKRADMNASIGFQQEDKLKKQALIQSKAESKRQNFDNLARKINDNDVVKETFAQNKIYKKAATYEMYEKLCHVQSL